MPRWCTHIIYTPSIRDHFVYYRDLYILYIYVCNIVLTVVLYTHRRVRCIPYTRIVAGYSGYTTYNTYVKAAASVSIIIL